MRRIIGNPWSVQKTLCSVIWNHKNNIENGASQPKRANEGPQLVGSGAKGARRAQRVARPRRSWPGAGHRPRAKRTAGGSSRERSRSGNGSQSGGKPIYSRSERFALECSAHSPESRPGTLEGTGMDLLRRASPYWS